MASLYVVATPIGNPLDLSQRAREVLSGVAIIAAEDTRRTGVLLAEIGVEPREIIAFHEHNEDRLGHLILDHLREGKDVALVSDAGTPLVSDPGFTLVRACWDQGVDVVPVPGPSAVTTALSVCPLATDSVHISGFLPARKHGRRERLGTLLGLGCAVLFFEAPHRVLETLTDLVEIAPNRRVFIARELTKQYESLYCDLPGVLVRELNVKNEVRGEFVCVVEARPRQVDEREAVRVMSILSAELSPAQAARLGAALLGRPKRELYAHTQSESAETRVPKAGGGKSGIEK